MIKLKYKKRGRPTKAQQRAKELCEKFMNSHHVYHPDLAGISLYARHSQEPPYRFGVKQNG